MELSEFLVGARWYSNDKTPPGPRGFFDGDIAEVIVYHRTLTNDQHALVERYLLDKYARYAREHQRRRYLGAKPLRTVANPAPVQCLMPGFEARELPLHLTNVNFLKYRYDGALFAGAYNGKIWLLRDTHGDGIEDQATLYYESPNIKSVMGLAVAPKGYPRGDGVFVATVGHVYFIPKKRRWQAEKRKSPWRASVAMPQIVSRMRRFGLPRGGASIARAACGFGLGNERFRTRPCLPDPKTGAMTYRIPDRAGARSSTSRRISRCGPRSAPASDFPSGSPSMRVAIFFCTDQEGATWLPNGNPLDELLYIQPERHYGFPPRHPQFLQGVVDEPSVFDFSPQHQSTCGFFFNEGAGPVFGPAWWTGDAFVCGESRGKLWRVMLAKTGAGYVAQTQLFAHLNMLPIDATLSPLGRSPSSPAGQRRAGLGQWTKRPGEDLPHPPDPAGAAEASAYLAREPDGERGHVGPSAHGTAIPGNYAHDGCHRGTLYARGRPLRIAAARLSSRQRSTRRAAARCAGEKRQSLGGIIA